MPRGGDRGGEHNVIHTSLQRAGAGAGWIDGGGGARAGVGGHVAAKNGFTLTAGLSFRHASRKFDGVRDNFMRIGPEIGFGGSGEQYFAYGLFDFHGIVNRVAGEGAGGVGLSLGAGAQGLLFNRLILGGEFAVPVDYIFNTDWLFPTEDGGMLVAFDLKLLVGVKF